jgi:hypothetical protein
VAVHVTIAGASSSIDMTLDGTRVAPLPGALPFPRTEDFGTAPISKIQLGDNSSGSSGRNFDVSEDEVVVTSGG